MTRPFEGIRVIDVTHVLAGPFATYQLAVLGADVRANDSREDYMRATLERGPDGLAYVTPLRRQDSSLLSDFAAADCLLVRPAKAPAAFRGEPCRIVPLR